MKTLEETFSEPLQTALTEAFPTLDELGQMVQYRLNKNLSDIDGDNLSSKAFYLIQREFEIRKDTKDKI